MVFTENVKFGVVGLLGDHAGLIDGSFAGDVGRARLSSAEDVFARHEFADGRCVVREDAEQIVEQVDVNGGGVVRQCGSDGETGRFRDVDDRARHVFVRSRAHEHGDRLPVLKIVFAKEIIDC